MSDSCLFVKLGAYAPLSDSDKEMLAELEREERDYHKDQIVRRTGEAIEELYVVKSGWLTSFSMLEDGRRQLLRLFYPGDLVDLSETALKHAQHDIKALTGSVLCPFPKSGLEAIFRSSPRLTALLFAMTVKENATLLDRIRAIGRLSAYERICYLLLEISARLRLTVHDVDKGFRLPLTQSDLADFLGLTNVYVSKTMSRIERDKLIARSGNRIQILDKARMREICEFQGVNAIDTNWFPGI